MTRKDWIIKLADVLLVLCLFSIFGGTLAPDVNEAHYLTKAKNFWDPSFCRGDLFLESADAHWLFFVVFGWPTLFTSLPVTAWLGRVVCWTMLAIGWSSLARTISPLRLAGGISAPLFLATLQWGHLSGEWVVGGCEAKSIAYAFAFLGLSAAMRHRWPATWICFGVSCGFHILTGGWIAFALVAALQLRYLYFTGFHFKLANLMAFRDRKLASSICIAAVFVAVGLIPALALNLKTDGATQDRAAMIYVFKRLPHHLTFRGFTALRWDLHLALIAVTVGSAIILHRVMPRKSDGVDLMSVPTDAFNVRQHLNAETRLRLNDWPLLIAVCFGGVIFAIIGLLIDIGLSSWATNWSSSLLRYYWFRWNDVAWPVALCTIALLLIDRQLWAASQQYLFRITSVCVWTMLLLPGGVLCIDRYLRTRSEIIPPADQSGLFVRVVPEPQARKVYRDWRAVCDFATLNSPPDAIFLTPRNQQTFKWYAQRAEVVSWKDTPQNATDVIRWYERLEQIFASQNDISQVITTARAIALNQSLDFDFVVLDRRFNPEPLTLPLLFQNDSYAVFATIK